MTTRDLWAGRLRTLKAMRDLCWARLLIRLVPFDRWRRTLGPAGSGAPGNATPCDPLAEGRKLAAIVERAAWRLPLRTQCLPRAMVLSWMLRGRGIGHAFVFAVRPAGLRDDDDALHAWVEIDRAKILGDLPGPWVETLRLGD